MFTKGFKMNRYIIPTLCIFLTSCATNIKNIEAVSDMASIVAFSDSSGNILLPLSSTKRTRIEEVDGKK
jgi:starvation-inducible outer membrane lipoprotein